MQDVQPQVSQSGVDSFDHTGNAIGDKALSDRNIQQATGQSLPSIKGDQLEKPDQTELKETQGQLLKQADGLLKKSSEKKAVTASLSGLKKSVAELKKAQNDSPKVALEALQKTEFPPALKVKITLGSGEKLSLIPPGEELENQTNLGELMEKAVKILEKHNDENFASFDQASTDREIANLKQQVSDIDQQIGEEPSGINDLARLENRQCLLTINVRARVEDGSVSATHIDGGPIAQQQTMGSSLAGPVHIATTDQPSQTEPEVGPNNDSSVRPETTAQGLTDASPADQDISINSADAGGDTAPPEDIAVAVTIDNPVIGDTSLIPGIMQGPSGQTDSTPGISSQPDGTQQTGGTGEDYSELDGVEDLFAEPANFANSAELDSGLSAGEVDQSDTESLKTEEELTEATPAVDGDSGLGGVAESDVDAEPIRSEVDPQPVETEADTQPIENEDNTQSIENEDDTQTTETKAKSTEQASVEEDDSEFDGIKELFTEPGNSASNAALDSGLSAGEVDQSDAESLKAEEELTEVTSAGDGDSGLDGVVAESDVDTESIRSEVDPQPVETEADTQPIETEDNTQSIENEVDTQTIETKAKLTEKTSVEEDDSEFDGIEALFAEPDSANDAALDSGLSAGEVDQSDAESLKTEEELTEVTSAGDGDSGLDGVVADSVVDAESMKTEEESTETTSAGDDDSGLDGGVAESDVDTGSISNEVDSQPIVTEADTQTIETKAKSTGQTSVEEDYSELDGVKELFAEPEVSGNSTVLNENPEPEVVDDGTSLDENPQPEVVDDGTSLDENPQPEVSGDSTVLNENPEPEVVDDGTSPDENPQPEVSGGSTALEDNQQIDVSASERSGDNAPIDSDTTTVGDDQSDVDTDSIQTEAKLTEQTSAEKDYSELDGIEELFAEPKVPGDSTALDENPEPEVSGDSTALDENPQPEVSGDSTVLNENPQPEVSGDSTVLNENPEPEVSGDSTALDENPQPEASGDSTVLNENPEPEVSGDSTVLNENPEPEVSDDDSTGLEDNQQIDVSASERSGDSAPIDSDTTTVGDDQTDVDTESPQTEAELTEETLVDEGFSEPDEVTGIDDSERSESVMQRSDDSDVAEASTPDESEFTAESPEPQDSVSSDSDYFSDDEGDQGTTQTLSPEPDFATDLAKESAPMERAEVVRQSTANIGEIARRRKESLRAASAPASTKPAPSSPAPRPATGIVNKPVDVSGVKSVVAGQINATRNAKSTDAISKEERARDKKKLGVSSTYNEASVIENAFDKLQKNAGKLEVSKDIAKTARKYIASEAQDSGRFLPRPNPQQREALRFLGLKSNASERDIRLALFDKASESAESGNRKHDSTMKTLSKHHKALFNK
ncbi:hypothetical protein ACTL6P_20505 [Endozoicomonas acroporae]|uniref:hypothetical protein n=1 Tax=Endozoicomonas acroporae TaxID=1701104 RepID=UPI000C767A69|nr:hypothetical protein [Endozoicomonas acroporae]